MQSEHDATSVWYCRVCRCFVVGRLEWAEHNHQKDEYLLHVGRMGHDTPEEMVERTRIRLTHERGRS